MTEQPEANELVQDLRLLVKHGARGHVVSAACQLRDSGIADPRVVAMAATDRDLADISYRARARQFAEFLAEVGWLAPGSVIIEGPPPAELTPPPPPGVYQRFERGAWDAHVAEGRVAKLTVTQSMEEKRWHQTLQFESASTVLSTRIPPDQSVTLVLDDLARHGWRTVQVVIERSSITNNSDHGEVSYPVTTAFHLEREPNDGSVR